MRPISPIRERVFDRSSLFSFDLAFRRGLRMIYRHVGRFAGVEAAVDVSVAQDDLDVTAGLMERNGFYKLSRFAERAPGAPGVGAARAGVVGGKRDLRLSVIGIQQLAEIIRSQL